MNPIRVLVVDDSAFARKVMREILERDQGPGARIEVVGIARDGLDALEKIAELQPDVVTLDLVMPDLDGIGVLRALPKESAARIVIVSVSNADTDIAITALELGAIDIVTKPTTLPTDRLYDLSSELVAKVRAAAAARLPIVRDAAEVVKVAKPASVATRLVVIGTSTGGPQALTQIFKSLPGDLPVAILIALHIPAGYTEALAARLDRLGEMRVTEAADGMEIVNGQAYLAPGGQHLKVSERGGRLFIEITREPLSALYHPSVSLLFETAARATGDGTLGLIMTGMGDDGLTGAQAIKRAGGRVIAESASSSVVYGMPRVVIESGLADFQGDLFDLAKILVEAIYQKNTARS